MKVFLILVSIIGLFGCQSEKKHEELAQKIQDVKLHTVPDLPKEMTFCGETINLEDEDIRERLDKEILVNTYFQSSTFQAMKRAHRYFPEMERTLKANGIPEDFKYLAVIESNLIQAVSPVGAQGFWQFMPFTAKEHAIIMNDEVDERLNIKKSTIAACEYLKTAHDTLKDWVLTAASYNRGIGGVRSDMRWQGTNNYFETHMNSETGRYVFRILAMKLIFENPEAYGYDMKAIELYKPFKTKTVVVKESIPNLAEWAIEQGFNYKILIKLNPWLLTNKLTIKNNKTFAILLPAKGTNLKPYESYK